VHDHPLPQGHKDFTGGAGYKALSFDLGAAGRLWQGARTSESCSQVTLLGVGKLILGAGQPAPFWLGFVLFTMSGAQEIAGLSQLFQTRA